MEFLQDYQQYMPLAAFILNGLLAGWMATRIFGGLGIFRNLIIGIMGSLLAAYAIRTGTVNAPPLFDNVFADQLAYSTAGALVILIFARLISHR